MLRKFRFFIQNRFPDVYKKVWRVYSKVKGWRTGERNCQLGVLHSDKKVYIIRVRKETLGLMGYYMAVLGHIRISKEKGAIPVVDMMNYKNPYLAKKNLGRKNSWEYYFLQTNQRISLEEAYKSQQVILSDLETPFEANPRTFYKNIYLNNQIGKYYDMVRQYIRFTPETKKILDMNYAQILEPVINQGKKVLGVVSRGTDILGFPGHSVQPSKEQLLDISQKLMEKYTCDYIFMASDANASIEFFAEQIGKEKVLVNKAKRYDVFDKNRVNVLSEIHFERENDEYLKGIEYLTTIYLLSKCNVLVGSIVGSTIGAICMNCGEYEHVEIIDKGVY